VNDHTTNGHLHTNINKDKKCEKMDSFDAKDLIKRAAPSLLFLDR